MEALSLSSQMVGVCQTCVFADEIFFKR